MKHYIRSPAMPHSMSVNQSLQSFKTTFKSHLQVAAKTFQNCENSRSTSSVACRAAFSTTLVQHSCIIKQGISIQIYDGAFSY